ncbi:putative integral membrane protein (TIGR02206 family) [Melghiribacillus thermohalophilus]|uniref:Putative integral membrane protein (TIGR02206 family) n=1 Tax=Melghiribacillus thermohalophilus TaxID=1324956 RepID=A0A4R3ND05_9BACI|nr:TIGR02206 family membrane protein [Melghiribacillus thermohalophilus]TCT26330.1 putative integral membrane protein (TIGR02206 family) [Melghiribacillus thermohalophilus]
MYWSNNSDSPPFVAFSSSHWIMLALFFFGIFLLVKGSILIQTHPPLEHSLRGFFFILLLGSEISYQVWTAANGVWNPADHLPLHLCGIASIVAATALLTNYEKLIQIAFFIGLTPAMLALITPELPYDFPHFRFFKFFIHHMIISWASLFLVLTRPVSIRFRVVLEVFIVLNLYALLIYPLNRLWNANYLYLNKRPEAATLLDFFGDGINYLISLEVTALFVFIIQWLWYAYGLNKYRSNKK